MSSSSFNTDDQKIEQMYESVLDHKEGWAKAKKTHLVCKIEGNDDPIVITNRRTSDENVHAEKILIEKKLRNNNTVNATNGSSDSEPDLSEILQEMSSDEPNKKSKDKKTKGSELLNITVYINNSPCSIKDHDCTGELIRFLDNYRRIKLNLFVTSLYKIRRESCKQEKHYDRLDYEVHLRNFSGLKSLMDHERCEIRAFTKAVWEDLFGIANVSQAVRDQLMGRYGTTTDDNDRSREEEDKRIQRDLDYIYKN